MLGNSLRPLLEGKNIPLTKLIFGLCVSCVADLSLLYIATKVPEAQGRFQGENKCV